jgi:molecular chaperone DnaK (HSP70)
MHNGKKMITKTTRTVGISALAPDIEKSKDEQTQMKMKMKTQKGEKGKGSSESMSMADHDYDSSILLSSVKRIWGMDATQIQSERMLDPNFLKDCPFDTVVHTDRNTNTNTNTGTLSGKDQDQDKKKDVRTVMIPVGGEQEVSPMDVVELLLETIRSEATAYFRREKEVAVGMDMDTNSSKDSADETLLEVRNCIITVPAHFSRNRREQMVQAAKKVGFDGHVGTMVESTAAAMAYGLFVAPMKEGVIQGRRIMVFDMGGGTTDVTIAQMIQKEDEKDPSFKVLGTAGERRLGGDDMDLKLAEYVKGELNLGHRQGEGLEGLEGLDKTAWNELRMVCRDAKEKLCGDGKDELPALSAEVRVGDQSVTITQETFYEAISSLVDRASTLVKSALDECQCSADSIDEVILVGGSTRTPPIRTMLQSRFRNELCYSIDPYAAVAQGAAIQGAIVSELVPRHELRNAMMLDALPHPIGVLVKSGEEEMYVPILESGMELPAMSFASFHLGDVRQKGVVIVAVEDVGEDLPLERIGEFTFLLHRLSDEEYDSMKDEGRMVDVGMTVDNSGKFIVSIFDKNDPDHLRKKERYQEWKRQQKNNGVDVKNKVYSLADITGKGKNAHSLAKEEILLVIGCAVLFICYVAVKMSFQEVEEKGSSIL